MKIVSLIILISCLLCSCAYASYKDYYEIDDYSEIWELSGFDYEYDVDNKIFPIELDKEHTKNFFCRYDQQIPLGEGFQIFLEVQYDDEELFNKETDNLRNSAFEYQGSLNERFSNAYATCTEQDKHLEYALIENDSMTIYYVYIQNLPIEEIEISQEFLLPDIYS